MTTTPPASEHDPDDRAARRGRWVTPAQYPITSIYLSLLVTVILLAVLFDWRL